MHKLFRNALLFLREHESLNTTYSIFCVFHGNCYYSCSPDLFWLLNVMVHPETWLFTIYCDCSWRLTAYFWQETFYKSNCNKITAFFFLLFCLYFQERLRARLALAAALTTPSQTNSPWAVLPSPWPRLWPSQATQCIMGVKKKLPSIPSQSPPPMHDETPS